MSRIRRMVSMFGLVALGACSPGGEELEGEARCQAYIERVTECYQQKCTCAETSTFCQCWRQGMDLSTDCTCVERDLKSLCIAVNLAAIDPSAYGCDAAMKFMANVCTDAQPLKPGTMDCGSMVGAGGGEGAGGTSGASEGGAGGSSEADAGGDETAGEANEAAGASS
jgi:hypothetical protein